MASDIFRFDEHWTLPDARVEELYAVLAHGTSPPQSWPGVGPKAAPPQ